MRTSLDTLLSAILKDDRPKVKELLQGDREIATRRIDKPHLYESEIFHWIYAGDTALHIAAAGFRFEAARFLMDHGADFTARNRRGAEPLHYASDCNTWHPAAQVATIECLVRAGANPNSTDNSGVSPLHRAVRTRCAAAVQALLSAGAKPDLPNGNGSTPLHLAVQNTGRGGSGNPEAVEQQRQIILLLLQNGASVKRRDGSGRTADQAATVGWIRELLEAGTE